MRSRDPSERLGVCRSEISPALYNDSKTHTLDIWGIKPLWNVNIHRNSFIESNLRRNIGHSRTIDGHIRWIEVFDAEFTVEFVCGDDTSIGIGTGYEDVAGENRWLRMSDKESFAEGETRRNTYPAGVSVTLEWYTRAISVVGRPVRSNLLPIGASTL